LEPVEVADGSINLKSIQFEIKTVLLPATSAILSLKDSFDAMPLGG
jgi:hypothetical protein